MSTRNLYCENVGRTALADFGPIYHPTSVRFDTDPLVPQADSSVGRVSRSWAGVTKMRINNSLRRLLSPSVGQEPAQRTHVLESLLDLCQAYNLAVTELHRLQVETHPRQDAIREFEGLCRDIEVRLMSCIEKVDRAGKAEGPH